MDPSIAPFIQNLGHALLRLQRPAEAREHFQLIADKAESPGTKARALTGVGLALADEGDESSPGPGSPKRSRSTRRSCARATGSRSSR